MKKLANDYDLTLTNIWTSPRFLKNPFNCYCINKYCKIKFISVIWLTWLTRFSRRCCRNFSSEPSDHSLESKTDELTMEQESLNGSSEQSGSTQSKRKWDVHDWKLETNWTGFSYFSPFWLLSSFRTTQNVTLNYK